MINPDYKTIAIGIVAALVLIILMVTVAAPGHALHDFVLSRP